ncbi:MAG: hypothetical protein SOT28_09305 [Fusicatenibacter sp.]|nr:hypothetical protein [Fusicatenibacter sp.]
MNGTNTKWLGVSHAAVVSADRAMEAVKAGQVKKHLIGNTSPIRYGTMEKKEMTEYSEFIRTKLCFEIMQLEGETEDPEDLTGRNG